VDWRNKTVLITGGTGSFGREFATAVLQKPIEKLIVLSRDELKQWEMAQCYTDDKRLRFFLGDVRDASRLERAFEGVDIVVHAAALKQVPAAEYNPFEFIKTNILGAENVINAALKSGVKKVVALSTDKAAAPINLYGATKLCSDKLFCSANNVRGKRDISFSVVRYGNVMGSRGSVIPFFLEKRSSGVLPITDPRMTRFNISLSEGVRLVMHALENSLAGEIFVPKIPSYKITDVAEAIGPNCEKPIIGIRPGEKIHEEMITHGDSPNTLECAECYVIVPSLLGDQRTTLQRYAEHHGGQMTPDDFRYSSGKNSQWLSVEQIREMIVEHVDPSFTISR
jgi:UDP-N-acetylglucosamine 4,6-dehydratase/5-epimerase